MKLVEKKCPNCGANLEFGENDKSCKCEYCKRSFEVERDENINNNNLSEQYSLNETGKTIAKVAGITMVAPFVIFLISFLTILTSIAFIVPTAIYKQDILPNKLLTTINNLDNNDLKAIEEISEDVAYQTAKGQHDLTYSYDEADSLKLEKLYFAYKEDSNYVIAIYKTMYHNFWNQTDQQTVYIPVVFKDVKNNITSSLINGKNPAPEYYFNPEKTTYVYAYSSFEKTYNEIVKPLENEYKITEK